MNSKLLQTLGVALLLGASYPVLAQTSAPTNTMTGGSSGSTSTTGSAGSTASGATTSTDAGTSTNSGAAAGASTSTDTTTSTGTSTGAGTTGGAGSTSQAAPTDGGNTTAAPGNTTSGGSTSTNNTNTTNNNTTTNTNTSTTNVEVTTEQRTEIRQVITEVNVAPVTDIDFDISVGIVVPQRVVLQPLPVRIVRILPAYEGYSFFLLPDGRIVIVEPDTLEIVFIID